MIILPLKNTDSIDSVNFFQNYNQYSYIDEFRSFPINSAEYLIKQVIAFVNQDIANTNSRVTENNISTDDMLFSKFVLSVKGEEDKNILDFLRNDQVRTFHVSFIDKLFYRFYVFDDYEFNPVKELNNNSWIHNSGEISIGVLYLSYSIGSNISVDTNNDIRIINFFVDKTVFEDNLYPLLNRLADSMIIEYFRHTSHHQIPMNTLSNYFPAYIIMPKFITVDAIIFIYNYFCLLASIYNKIIMEFGNGDYGTMSEYIKYHHDLNNRKEMDLEYYDKFSYYKSFLDIVTNRIDSDTILDELYKAYCEEVGLTSS